MKVNFSKYLFLVFFIAAKTIPAVAQDWQFRKSIDGIEVYFRESPDSRIKELKITCRVQSSLAAAVAVISDAAAFSEWVYQCREARVIEGNSMQEFVYYNLSNFPWPLTDREFILRCTTYQDPHTLTVYSLSTAAPDLLSPNKRYIRVLEVDSNWVLHAQENGFIDVEYYLRSDPGGNIPAWMVNWALDIGPVKSLKKLRDRVQSDTYRNYHLAFIREPLK